jgi:hypothetical protein
MTDNKPPLDDPFYEPEHPPVNERIPDEVAKFGPRTQIRWFNRFRAALNAGNNLNDYYVTSENHKGPCCASCIGEFEDGYQRGGVIADGWCCCLDSRITQG